MDSWWGFVLFHTGGYGLIIAWVVWAVVGVTMHELAHGWAAIAKGDDTPIQMGHMTGNPLVHMGTQGLICFDLIGLPSGAMPVDPTRLRGRHADAWVYFCGPLMNLALAGVCILGVVGLMQAGGSMRLSAIAKGGAPLDIGVVFAFLGAWLNLGMALFNLLPVLPLDGGGILRSYSRPYRNLMEGENGQLISLTLFILLFLFAGRFIWPLSDDVVTWAVQSLNGLIGVRGAAPTP
ncbi:MAG: site-2 protease family protein [Phycisphaerales bacterium]|nr:site-2 protease family protein [Phycisphaerales bacterium]